MTNLDPTSAGVTAVLFGVVLALFEFLKRIWPGGGNGQSRVVVDCPHKIHTLNATIERLEGGVDGLVEKHRLLDVAAINHQVAAIGRGMTALEESLQPRDGIAQWKRNQMQDTLLQKIIDRTSESVTLQQKSLLVLEQIAKRETRREDKKNVNTGKFSDKKSPG